MRREISWAPGKLLRCSSWSFSSYFSPAFLVPTWCDSFSYQICTCQINPFTSNLSHSFQRCCSAFLFVISRLSSSTEEPLDCPSSPYERGQKACVYPTDWLARCTDRRTGAQFAAVYHGSWITELYCLFPGDEVHTSWKCRHASCKHKELTVVGPYTHITKYTASSVVPPGE